MLRVHIISACNLINVDTFGKSDPYVSCSFRGSKQKTSVVEDNLNPKWNESLQWDLDGSPISRKDQLELLVKDDDFARHKLLGRVDLQLRNIISGKGAKELDLTLLDKEKQQTPSKIKIKIEYSAPVSTAQSQSSSKPVSRTSNSKPVNSNPSPVLPTGKDDGGSVGASAPSFYDDEGSGAVSSLLVLPIGSRPRDLLPDQEMKFQIRVKVIEGRQLMGEDLSPSCRIQVGDQGKVTQVQKSTSCPWFNELFFFYIEMKPRDAWNIPVELKICNSRMMRSKVTLGSFRLDLGTIYDQPQHSVINKWMTLLAQDDLDTEVKGYLKASVVVLGPHDECPDMNVPKDSEDDEVENNLLMTSQVNRTPATFTVNVYQAEDLPRMDAGAISKIKSFFRLGDSDSKQCVDPYVKVSFAGRTAKTQIETENCNPLFMEALYIGAYLPTFANSIKIVVKDWDRASSSDTIATCSIPMANISTTEVDGFLPTFGPAFVNLYGGVREFSPLQNETEEQLNKGKGEGCAYRGRLLLSINTSVGELPELESDPITDEQRLRIGSYLRRKSYYLHCSFEDAAMISDVNAPLEFEVSMGNYGNKFEDSEMPSSSFTQPTNAVFDGSRYYYLPWEDSKPCVTISCQWEDVSHRLFSVNLLTKIVEDLSATIEFLQSGSSEDGWDQKRRIRTNQLLKQLIDSCRQPLPNPEIDLPGTNPLDRHLYEKRRKTIENLLKEIMSLSLNEGNVDGAIEKLERFSSKLVQLSEEPQSSMPDVIIWMLSEKSRIAYARVPAHSILFGEDPSHRGANCGHVQMLTLRYPGECSDDRMAGLLRVRLWLGRKTENAEWLQLQKNNEILVYAETYENQTSIVGNWVTSGPLMTRPHWSDAEGDLELPKDVFVAPRGWQFDDDWFVDPELSLFYEADAGHSTFLEDVFENEIRLPAGDWTPDLTHWSDVRKDPATPRDEIVPPKGWEWDDAWQVDNRRAVDEEGWEYCVESSMGGYGPVQKLYHLSRRRRWTRSRTHTAEEDVQDDVRSGEGWSYASFFGRKFHARERRVDMVRRRRWHRRMVMLPGSEFEPPTFKFKSDDKDEKMAMGCPMLYVRYSGELKFQLRAYIYQARQLHSGDKSGLSDPYAYVSFMKRSAKTLHQKATVCPTWDETLILDSVTLYGDLEEIRKNPPPVIVEFFDHDTYGEPDFLGRVSILPEVCLHSSESPMLSWHKIKKTRQHQGELLASFELLYMGDSELQPPPPKKEDGKFQIPESIRPQLQRTAIEILCWGVRNMKRYKLTPVQKPTVEFECGGKLEKSDVLANVKEHPNFNNPFLFMEMMLPRNSLYMPPLNIKVRDRRMFGENPVVGKHIIKSLDKYRIEPLTAIRSSPIRTPSTHSANSLERPESTVIEMGDVSEEDTLQPSEFPAISQPDIGQKSGKLQSCLSAKSGYTHLEEFPESGQYDENIQTSSCEYNAASTLATPPQSSVAIRGNFSGEMTVYAEGVSNRNSLSSAEIQHNQLDSLEHHFMETDGKNIDWWSKYYASTGDLDKSGEYLDKGYEKMEIYPVELEKVSAFGEFRDILETFTLTRGKSTGDDGSQIAGEFRGTIRVYDLPEDSTTPLPPRQLRGLPPSSSEELLVRVYVVRCHDLCPTDASGLSDPYLKVSLGDKQKNSRDDYCPNTLSPIFGRCFEFSCTLPRDKELTVSVLDYDLLSKDDLIGETTIDLENRYMTKFRATCGLQRQYHLFGPNQWRDSHTPRDILTTVCLLHNKPQPYWPSKKEVIIGERQYKLDQLEDPSIEKPSSLGEEDQRLALLVLQTLDLVPEHVETRKLLNPSMPDLEQGKIEMFVDILPKSSAPAPPLVDITPRTPTRYIVRVVVYNVYDVLLQEYSAVSGSHMSDVYIKCWLQGDKDEQKTDVHYRCMDGEAMFNWRFVFEMDYLEAERMMITKSKDHFWSLDSKEVRKPPRLMLQLWDDDLISSDDYLGELELDLCRIPPPVQSASKCGLHQVSRSGVGASKSTGESGKESKSRIGTDEPDDRPLLRKRKSTRRDGSGIDIWQRGRLRGFWPAVGQKDGQTACVGKMELEVEVLTEDQAELRPAGKAREEPNQYPALNPPKRPSTSFLWFSSPWKTFRYILWGRYKCFIITLPFVILLLLFLFLALYSLPGAVVDKLLGV